MIWRCCLGVALSLLCLTPQLHGQVVTDDPQQEGEADIPLESIPPPRPVAPTPQRVTLGISVAPVSQQAVLQYGLVVRSGALITMIVPGSPADRVGLPIGGVIAAFGWSPDSSRIAYRANQRLSGFIELFTVLPDGSDNLRVSGAPTTGGNVTDFRWSPDSSFIAYRANQDTAVLFELFVTTPDGRRAGTR